MNNYKELEGQVVEIRLLTHTLRVTLIAALPNSLWIQDPETRACDAVLLTQVVSVVKA